MPCEVILYSAGRQNKGREPENVDRRGEEMNRNGLRRGAAGNLTAADSENFMDKCVMNVTERGFLNSAIPNKEIMYGTIQSKAVCEQCDRKLWCTCAKNISL